MIRTENFTVKFSRNYTVNGYLNKKGTPSVTPVSTTASVFDKDNNLLSEKTAYCGPNDIFQKETGRRIALVRAVSTVYFDKESRKEILSAYFGRKNGKK